MASATDFTFDCRDSKRQVLGSFEPATASLEQAKSRSYELKGIELHKQLQDYNIRLAKSRVLPTFVFTTQTPLPLELFQQLRASMSASVSNSPCGDGFKRIRNVSRQKAVLQQIGAEKTVKEDGLEDKWFTDLTTIQDTSVALKNSQTLKNLARLKANQKTMFATNPGSAPHGSPGKS